MVYAIIHEPSPLVSSSSINFISQVNDFCTISTSADRFFRNIMYLHSQISLFKITDDNAFQYLFTLTGLRPVSARSGSVLGASDTVGDYQGSTQRAGPKGSIDNKK